jgi:hypothetical protein
MKLQSLMAGVAFAAAVATAGLAQAATSLTLDLTVADPTAGLNPGPYGTVTITEDMGSLLFTVTPDNGAQFNVNNNSQHHAFVFDLVGAGVSISDVTTDFSAAAGPVSDAPFGDWEYAIDYTGMAKQGGAPASLSFTVSDAANDLTVGSLASFSSFAGVPLYAAADIFDGKTGNVGATLAPTGVPEPATWAVMLLGFGGIGAAMRSRRVRPATA